MKILVVDDVQFNLTYTEKLLKKQGYEVLTATGSMAALDMLKADSTISVVICDYLMPEMNGIDLYQACLKLPRFKNLGAYLMPPFILNTSYNDQDELQRALKIGFTDILKKPTDPSLLSKILQDVANGAYTVKTEQQFLKILSGDPKEKNQFILQTVVSGSQHQLCKLSSGKEILDVLKQDMSISVVISELELADMDVWSLLQEANHLERFNDEGKVPLPPFILMTENPSVDVLQKATEMGFYDVMVSPVNKDRLAAKLSSIYNQGKDTNTVEEMRKILVVDDVGFSRSFLEKSLRDCGYKILTTGSGYQALEFLKTDPAIDIVLCDLMMPEIDGIELYSQFKAFECEKSKTNSAFNQVADPDFYLITASNNMVRLQEAHSLGFKDVLKKPVSVKDLKNIVAQSELEKAKP